MVVFHSFRGDYDLKIKCFTSFNLINGEAGCLIAITCNNNKPIIPNSNSLACFVSAYWGVSSLRIVMLNTEGVNQI